MKKIGIPRGLLFYTYYPFWRTFFEELGLEVVISPPTSKAILDEGVRAAVDETCLPVKVFYGHVLELYDKVDYLFIPRIVSIERNAFICPKFMGLPEMIKISLPGTPEMIDTCIDLSKGNSRHFGAFREVGLTFTRSIPKIVHAYYQASRNLKKYQSLMLRGYLPNQAISILYGRQERTQRINAMRTIAVLGHPYNVYDEHVNMNILDKLINMGVRPLTLEMISPSILEKNAKGGRKQIFWTFGKHILGAIEHVRARRDVDGIIYLTSFGCGPDSMIGEIVERRCYRAGTMPFMRLNLDEHSGEAGLLTRLEAFVDMIKLGRAAK